MRSVQVVLRSRSDVKAEAGRLRRAARPDSADEPSAPVDRDVAAAGLRRRQPRAGRGTSGPALAGWGVRSIWGTSGRATSGSSGYRRSRTSQPGLCSQLVG